MASRHSKYWVIWLNDKPALFVTSFILSILQIKHQVFTLLGIVLALCLVRQRWCGFSWPKDTCCRFWMEHICQTLSNKETWFGVSRWVSVWSRGSSDEYMEGLMASRVLGESWVRLGKCMNMFPIKFVFKSIKNAGILIPDHSCWLDPQEFGIQSLGMMPRAFFRCLEGGLQTQRQLPSQPKNRTYTTAKCRFC